MLIANTTGDRPSPRLKPSTCKRVSMFTMGVCRIVFFGGGGGYMRYGRATRLVGGTYCNTLFLNMQFGVF